MCDTKLHVIVRIQFWRSDEHRVLPRSTLTRSGSTRWGVIYGSKYYSYWTMGKKIKSKILHRKCKYEYAMNVIP